MDHEKKKLKLEYARLVGKLERLLRRYTPIDPSDEFSDGDDYDALAPPLVSLLMRGCGREEIFRAIESYRANYWIKVPPNPEQDWKITDAVQKAYLNKDKVDKKSRKQSKPLFKLNLYKDLEDVLDYIKTQVQKFLQEAETVDGVADRVYRIEGGYEYSQCGWVMIYFDTRPGASPDGQWTRFIDKHRIERIHWRKASSANMRGPVSVVDHEGKEHLISEGSEIDISRAIGLMLKSALLRARDQGILLQLSLAPTCALGVEDFDGHFGWPTYGTNDDDALVTQIHRRE